MNNRSLISRVRLLAALFAPLFLVAVPGSGVAVAYGPFDNITTCSGAVKVPNTDIYIEQCVTYDGYSLTYGQSNYWNKTNVAYYIESVKQHNYRNGERLDTTDCGKPGWMGPGFNTCIHSPSGGGFKDDTYVTELTYLDPPSNTNVTFYIDHKL